MENTPIEDEKQKGKRELKGYRKKEVNNCRKGP
jgi:hypothetical protein